MHPAFSTRSDAARPVNDLIQQARQGIVRRRVDEVARLVGLTDKEMARILNMSVRSLHGKTDSELLTSAASERLLLLERLIQHGLSVFDGRADVLSRWLRTPLAELSYREEVDTVAAANEREPIPVRSLGQFNEPTPVYAPTDVQKSADESSFVVPQSPLAVLDTVSGFSLAEDVLSRIEWGIVG